MLEAANEEETLAERKAIFLCRSKTLKLNGLANLIDQQTGNGEAVMAGALLPPSPVEPTIVETSGVPSASVGAG